MTILTIEISASQHRKLEKIASTKNSWTVEKVAALALKKGLAQMKVSKKIDAKPLFKDNYPEPDFSVYQNGTAKDGYLEVIIFPFKPKNQNDAKYLKGKISIP